jgi:hypothetical protein
MTPSLFRCPFADRAGEAAATTAEAEAADKAGLKRRW